MKTLVLNGWAASPRAWDLCRFRREGLFSYIDQLDGRVEAELAATSEPMVLVGWSMGGSMALQLYLKAPEKIAALVLIAVTPRMMQDEGWKGMSERRLQALEVGLKLTHGEGFLGPVPGRPNPYQWDTDENLARGLDYLRATDLRDQLLALRDSGRIAPPVWIFQSEHDGVVRPSNADFLRQVFPAAEVMLVPGAEHALPILIPAAIDAAVAKAQQTSCPSSAEI